MDENLVELVRHNDFSAQLIPIRKEALKLLDNATVVTQSMSTSRQPSSEVADIWEFRSKTGYYKKGSILGVSESVSSLREKSVDVRFMNIETSDFSVAAWAADDGTFVGLIIVVFDKSPTNQ